MAKHKSLKDVRPEHQFILKTGEKIKNLEELVSKLRGMADDVFTHHVNDTRNDFRRWINDIINDKPLADALGSLLRKNEILTAISSRMRELKKRKEHATLAAKIIKKPLKKLPKKTPKEIEKKFRRKRIQVVEPLSKEEWVANKMVDLSSEIAKKVNEVEQSRKEFTEKTHLVSGINDFFLGLVIGLILGLILAKALGLR